MSPTLFSPRTFVSSFAASYPNIGAYTVIPYSNGYLLDLPFHLDRLESSLHYLDQINRGKASSPVDEPTTTTSFREAFRKKVNSKVLDSAISSGTLTICVAKRQNDYVIDTLCSKRKPYKLNEPFYHTTEFVDVCFVECHRKYPMIKYCDWTRERKLLEEKNTNAVHEIVMFHRSEGSKPPQYELTEGLISNIFAINENGNFVSPPLSQVLEGSMRRIIMACLQNQLEVCLEEPILLSNLSRLKGMFLVSSTKDLIPVRGVFSSDGKLVKEFAESCYTSSKKLMLLRSDLRLVLDPNIPREVNPLRSIIAYDLWSKLPS
jgi:hypothetical protein